MIVVDASVIVKWVLDENGSDSAIALRQERLSAPALWLIEAANALWATAARGAISSHEAEERLAMLRGAPIETTPVEEDIAAALEIANELRHPIYDCLYLAAALRIDTHVVTADRRFVHACSRHEKLARHVKLLGT